MLTSLKKTPCGHGCYRTSFSFSFLFIICMETKIIYKIFPIFHAHESTIARPSLRNCIYYSISERWVLINPALVIKSWMAVLIQVSFLTALFLPFVFLTFAFASLRQISQYCPRQKTLLFALENLSSDP